MTIPTLLSMCSPLSVPLKKKKPCLFCCLQELVSLKPCKAAELVATHFSGQIEVVIGQLQVGTMSI